MKIKVVCPKCFGGNQYCSVCKGEGVVWIEGEAEKLSSSMCRNCNGKGFLMDNDTKKIKLCSICSGTGKKLVSDIK